MAFFPRRKSIRVWRNTLADWTSGNPLIAVGEPFYVTDTQEFGLGTGAAFLSTVRSPVSGSVDPVATGELIPANRYLGFSSNASCTLVASQQMQLHYFTARKTEAINNMETYSGSTAAGATPTLARVGVFQIASNGDGTLLAACANDTAMWSVVNTAYNKALTSTFNKVAGQRYALAALIVTAAAIPSLHSMVLAATAIANNGYGLAPRVCGAISGQADLPASFTAGSVGSSRQVFTALLTP